MSEERWRGSFGNQGNCGHEEVNWSIFRPPQPGRKEHCEHTWLGQDTLYTVLENNSCNPNMVMIINVLSWNYHKCPTLDLVITPGILAVIYWRAGLEGGPTRSQSFTVAWASAKYYSRKKRIHTNSKYIFVRKNILHNGPSRLHYWKHCFFSLFKMELYWACFFLKFNLRKADLDKYCVALKCLLRAFSEL